jgi:mannosyltransferase
VVIAVLVLLPIALVLRIGRWSLWADEAFSVSTSNRSWESLAKLTYKSEATGVIYAAVLRQWLQVDMSVAWMRGLSVVCVVLCVPLLFGVGRRLFNETAAAASVVMFGANATVLRYGQHIRFYSLVLLLALLTTYGFVRDVCAETKAARWRAAWSVSAALLVATHLLAVPLLVALGFARLFAEPSRRRIIGTALGLVPSGITALVVAYLVTRRDEGQSLVTFHPIRTLSDVVQSMAGTPGVLGTIFVVIGIAGLMFCSRLPFLARQNRFPFALVVAGVLIPTLLLYFTSWVRPSLLGRYVLYSVPFLCLLAGAMVAELLNQVADASADGAVANGNVGKLRLAGALASIGAILIGSLFGISRWHRGVEVADWKTLAAEVFENSEPGDAIVFANDSNRLFFEYYRPLKGPRAALMPVPLFPIEPWGGFETGKQQYRVFPPAVIENAKDTRRRLWVVVEAGLVEASFPALDQLQKTPILRERETSAGFVRLYDVTKTKSSTP